MNDGNIEGVIQTQLPKQFVCAFSIGVEPLTRRSMFMNTYNAHKGCLVVVAVS